MLSTKQWQIVSYVIMGLFVAGIIWIMVLYFSSASLTLVTDSPDNKLYIHENKPVARNINVSQNSNQVTARLDPGTYTVTAQGPLLSTAQVVEIGIGQHKTVVLNLGATHSSPISDGPVTSFGAAYFTASADHITFVDSNDPNGPLYSVDKSNTTALIDGKHSYKSARWADDSFGIGLISTGSASYGLVKIDGSAVTEIALPFTPDNLLTYTISPNRAWYVSDGHIIYRANGDGSFTKVYTADTKSTVSVASASDNALLFTQKESSSNREGSLVVLHTDGTKYEREGELYNSAWSPSGDRVVTTGDTAEIFDDKLNPVKQLPQGNFISPSWLDDNTLTYSIDNNLWEYSLTGGGSNIIGSIDSTIGSISVIKPDTDHNFLYVTVYMKQFQNVIFSLYRIKLNSQTIPDPTTAQRLSVIMPSISAACYINYMNFTNTTIVTRQLTAGQNCVDIAKNDTVGSKVINQAEVQSLNFQQLSY